MGSDMDDLRRLALEEEDEIDHYENYLAQNVRSDKIFGMTPAERDDPNATPAPNAVVGARVGPRTQNAPAIDCDFPPPRSSLEGAQEPIWRS